MWYLTFNIIFLFVITNYISAHDLTSDSVYKYFPEVQVEAEKILFANEKKFSAFSEINKSIIKTLNPRQLSDLLNNQHGITIRDYGGLGGLKTISLRGTSSQQTLFMLEGMRLNNAGNSYFDISIFPVSMINSIDILRGGSSAFFGGSSIGGTVNINLDKELTNRIRAELYTGSFGEYFGTSSINYNLADVNFGISSEYISSEGDFPFTSNQFGKEITYYRENAKFENLNVLLHLSSNYNKYKLKFITLGNTTNRGAPGPVLLGYQSPSNAVLKDKGITSIFKLEHSIERFSFHSGILFKYNNLDYINSGNLYLNDSSNSFYTKSIHLNSQFSIRTNSTNIVFGFEAEYSDIFGDFIDPGMAKKAIRLNSGISSRLYRDIYSSKTADLAVQLGARYDFYSDINYSPSAIAGLSMNLYDYNLSISSQVSYNFRPPSFNEMYYLNYGTNNLKPERSTSMNLSTSYNYKNLNFTINGFWINTLDQIIAVPKSTLSWSAQNVESVLSKGVELSLTADIIKNIINTGCAYTIQNVSDNNKKSITYGKLIVYIPQEILHVYLNTSFNRFNLRLNVNYTSFTYAMPDNNYYSLIPSYLTGDLHISRALDISESTLRFNFDIINLTNQEYRVIKNYPMPGRIFRFGVAYEYANK